MSRQPFNTRWAQGVESEDNLNTFKDPGAVRISTGWEGGQDKDAPPAGHENYWHNRVDSALQGVERNGVMGWHPQAIYGRGAPTYGPDGNYYESLSEGNTGNNPTSTNGYWRYAGPSFFAGYEPGDVKIVAHNNIPSAGWLKCSGAVLSRALYPRLFSAIQTTWNTGGESASQFRLPDFRGVFLRGFDDGSGLDPSRAFGSYQTDAIGRHKHKTYEYDTGDTAAIPDGSYSFDLDGTLTRRQIGHEANYLVAYEGGLETRPKNKTVSYWIKY